MYPTWFVLDGPRHVVEAVSIDVEFRTSYLRSGLHWPVRPPTQPLARDHWLLGKWGARLCLHWRSHAGISCSLDLCVVQRPAGVGLGCRRSIVVVVLIRVPPVLGCLGDFSNMHPWCPRSPQDDFASSPRSPQRCCSPFQLIAGGAYRSYYRRDKQQVHAAPFLGITGAYLSAVTVATLIPTGEAYSYPFVINNKPMPPWFHQIAPHLVPGTVVLVYPYPGAFEQQAMAWQAINGMSFRIVGGWGIVPLDATVDTVKLFHPSEGPSPLESPFQSRKPLCLRPRPASCTKCGDLYTLGESRLLLCRWHRRGATNLCCRFLHRRAWSVTAHRSARMGFVRPR